DHLGKVLWTDCQDADGFGVIMCDRTWDKAGCFEHMCYLPGPAYRRKIPVNVFNVPGAVTRLFCELSCRRRLWVLTFVKMPGWKLEQVSVRRIPVLLYHYKPAVVQEGHNDNNV